MILRPAPRRPWLKRRVHERTRPDPAFYQYFSGPGVWASERLWLAYQRWRNMRRDAEFANFKEYLLNSRENTRKQVEAWQNPFKNGRKGEKYSCSFPLPPGVKNYIFHGLDRIGLTLARDCPEKGSCTISGIPPAAGEFTITFGYSYPGYVFDRQNCPPLQRKLTININPDPRELWKNIPTDRNIEYYKEEADADLLVCGERILAAASQRGRSHAHTGLPRDDDFKLVCVSGWSILAVADGAGSAQFSRQGSALAVYQAVSACAGSLAEGSSLDAYFAGLPSGANVGDWLPEARKMAYNVLPNAFFEAYKAIRDEARQMEREPKEYATTLLMALCKKYPVGWIVMSFQIGDGAMAMFYNGNMVKLLAEPDEGEYGGQTRFITMKEMYEGAELMRRLRVDCVATLNALALMTDGVSDAKFATLANLRNPEMWSNLGTEIFPLVRGPNPREGLLAWLQFWSQGNHDDRTLAIMYQGGWHG